MWIYEKKLQYPVRIKNADPKAAKILISQFGGPDGELGASMRYLSQRYSTPYPEIKAILTDIGTEELAHMEMVSAMVQQLTRDLTPEEIIKTVAVAKEELGELGGKLSDVFCNLVDKIFGK